MKIDQFISGEVVDHLVNGIVLVGFDGSVLDANAGALAYFGYSRSEMLALNVRDLRAPHDSERAVEQYREAAECATTFEALALRSDGTVFPTECRSSIVESGGERAVLVAARDITERKHVENALQQSKNDLLEAQRLAHVGSWIYDPATDSIEWSAEMFRIWGVDPECGAPRIADHAKLIHPDDLPGFSIFHAALRDGTPYRSELRILHPDGSVKTVIASCEAERDASGTVVSLRGANQDITERKRAEEAILRLNTDLDERVRERTAELTAANEDLAEATRVKSDFLAAMSHELRTPLNSVIGFSDLLATGMVGELKPEQAKQIGMINASGKQLLSLVDGILDLSRIEAGRTAAVLEDFDVALLVDAVVDMLRPLADKKNLTLTVACGAATERLKSDPQLVGQILTNLLGNAVKFTDSGSVSLNVFRQGGHMLFEVADTGRGIAVDDVPHVMERFYQATPVEEAKNPGTGLGLAISRNLAEMIGGALEVTSECGLGSTFTLRVPV